MPRRTSTYPLPSASTFSQACELAIGQLITDVIGFHTIAVVAYGGRLAVRDPGLLLSAIARPFASAGGALAYGGGVEQAAALLEGSRHQPPV